MNGLLQSSLAAGQEADSALANAARDSVQLGLVNNNLKRERQAGIGSLAGTVTGLALSPAPKDPNVPSDPNNPNGANGQTDSTMLGMLAKRIYGGITGGR